MPGIYITDESHLVFHILAGKRVGCVPINVWDVQPAIAIADGQLIGIDHLTSNASGFINHPRFNGLSMIYGRYNYSFHGGL